MTPTCIPQRRANHHAFLACRTASAREHRAASITRGAHQHVNGMKACAAVNVVSGPHRGIIILRGEHAADQSGSIADALRDRDRHRRRYRIVADARTVGTGDRRCARRPRRSRAGRCAARQYDPPGNRVHIARRVAAGGRAQRTRHQPSALHRARPRPDRLVGPADRRTQRHPRSPARSRRLRPADPAAGPAARRRHGARAAAALLAPGRCVPGVRAHPCDGRHQGEPPAPRCCPSAMRSSPPMCTAG
jgi:hypothetical protein